jgi:hypothetical protein
MDREKALRDGEREAVERWFPRGPLGRLFDAGDGRMLSIRDDVVPAWRDEAFAVIDAFVADTQRLRPDGVAVIAAVALASFLAIHFHHGAYAGVAVGIGMAAVHILGMLRHQRYKRDLAAVRGRILHSLASSVPLPADLGKRFRQGNHWRTALNVWVGLLVIAAGLAAHFMAPDPFPPIATVITIACIGIAWMLFFLARHADHQHRVSH